MARKTIYMGPRLKRMRRELGLTQANMASDLEISPSYIALMERNQRPVTAELLLKLAATYRIDIADLADSDNEDVARRLEAVLRDPIFADIDLPALDVADVATSFPGFAEALLRVHAAYSDEHLALAQRRSAETGAPAVSGPTNPVVEARAFLAARRNCFPALDDSAADLAGDLTDLDKLCGYLTSKHGLKIEFVETKVILGSSRWHDYHRRRVFIDESLDYSGRRFQAAVQLAMLEQEAVIAALLDEGHFETEDGRELVKQALQSYWAAALLMPYDLFAKSAEQLRYDIGALAASFMVSFEQAAHRLTTLQKQGTDCVPFFFLRVDRAGNVSKRLDGAGFPFAGLGSTCPLWNIHRVFDTPGKIDAQLIELPDARRYVSIARTVRAGGKGYGAPSITRAIALTCSEKHLGRLIYADKLQDLEPVGIGEACRLCHRPKCVARSAPPIGREISSNRFRETGIPFSFSGD
ncbi:ImmA/IrrE family metallo-endopeptidase [Altererythrobacter salegens]|uniref:ImmA/IrrE family metallo-endopeptidase n=1 Tax=Croceibacterium salegens TaxID=1737568 RepID=A0A6I4SZN6_9SPHN|nr:short-chain fatty acyl-CoA regulator family protein [Croceibacterium salegens]MXO61333.1 ImmA/IrrE family metallo-endopeptidase [Croceibacterium salegens]